MLFCTTLYTVEEITMNPDLLVECLSSEPPPAEGTVEVIVSETGHPLVLSLMAVLPTHWRLVFEGAVELEAVILSGKHPQRISGLPANTHLEVHTLKPSPCDRCIKSDGYFVAVDATKPAYEEVLTRLKKITGKTPSTTQLQRTATEVRIGS